MREHRAGKVQRFDVVLTVLPGVQRALSHMPQQLPRGRTSFETKHCKCAPAPELRHQQRLLQRHGQRLVRPAGGRRPLRSIAEGGQAQVGPPAGAWDVWLNAMWQNPAV